MKHLKELLTSLLGREPEIWELTEVVEAVDKDSKEEEEEEQNTHLFG